MEKLTKAAFWDECYAKYPTQVKAFCEWVDEYKKRENWNLLFNAAPEFPAPKYHDLPIAMQIGIFLQFTFEVEKYHDLFDNGPGPVDMEQFVAGMRDWFFHEHDYAVQERDGAFEGDDGAMTGTAY